MLVGYKTDNNVDERGVLMLRQGTGERVTDVLRHVMDEDNRKTEN